MEQTAVRIGELEVPESLDSRGADGFTASAELANLVNGLVWGNNDLWVSPGTRLEAARPSSYAAMRLWAAKDGERHVGRALLEFPLLDNRENAFINVMVHPEYRRQRIGTRLLHAAEEAAAAAGRQVLMSWVKQAGQPAEPSTMTVLPRSGPGALPEELASVRFALASGFVLEQVERISVLQLPADPEGTGRLLAEAQTKAGPDYRLLTWEGGCPPEHVEQYARLRQRMSTDVPQGQLEYAEEHWDAERVRHDEAEARAKGGRVLVSAALHKPTGELAGHTILEYYPDQPEVAYQEDTLVLQAHRGHSLGMLIKAANLVRASELWPAARRLMTWNASENEHMLAINVRLGFRPVGYEAAWQKRLAGLPGQGR
ncbi:acetyltransferase (GNAT) family protein [Arthrobacter crystallopoietes BAB-32]|uniref:Acetyltransferase (GNAT) family protein n=1 Tax=Arthrobacter crystallopoietes BAB-32 TaxID=1246476 RepID=N1UWF5_9MICC|nr:GNAT family N-acetyltransferase [Arthrobacter crystallopoietes]EMY33390.1 acetyltransferase (GNAT) family protein [Arthrobacter crystallopoietes BAB-32]